MTLIAASSLRPQLLLAREATCKPIQASNQRGPTIGGGPGNQRSNGRLRRRRAARLFPRPPSLRRALARRERPCILPMIPGWTLRQGIGVTGFEPATPTSRRARINLGKEEV